MHNRFYCFIIYVFIFTTYLTAQQAEQYELAKIEFTGNDEISSAELKTIIYSEETPWWFYKFLNSFTSFGKEPVYFDSSSIAIDLGALRDYYNVNGFFNARFSYSYSADTSSKTVTLTYKIEENQPAHYGKIDFLGLDNLPENIKTRVFWESRIDTSNTYKQTDVEKSIAHTVEILVNRGYMYINHDSTMIYIDTTLNTAGIGIYFSTGNRYKISDILIDKKGEGAPHVSETLIRYITDINKEEYYNLEKIKQSQSRLSQTGLFNSLSIKPVEKDTVGDHVPLIIEGNIGNMNELLPGISVNNELKSINLGVNATYTRKNFLGDARKLTLTSEIAVIDIPKFNFKEFFSDQNYNIDGYATINLKIEQPFLFGKPILGILENYFETFTLEKVNDKTYGVRTSFDFELPAFTFINQFKPYYNLEFLDRKGRDVIFKNIDSTIGSFTEHFRTSFLGLMLGSAKANNLFFPTGGSNQLLNMEVAISNVNLNINGPVVPAFWAINGIAGPDEITLNETVLFYRLEHTSSLYQLLSADNSFVLAVKNKLGYMQTFKGQVDLIPANKTFFAGGANSIRGWNTRDFPQNKPQTVEDSLDLYKSPSNQRGGTFLFEGTIEVRKRFLENLGFVLFTDYGNVWNGYTKFRYDEVAIAAGFGFRYYSQIAPFRLDFGFKMYDPENKQFIWHNWKPVFIRNITIQFGVGEAF